MCLVSKTVKTNKSYENMKFSKQHQHLSVSVLELVPWWSMTADSYTYIANWQDGAAYYYATGLKISADIVQCDEKWWNVQREIQVLGH